MTKRGPKPGAAVSGGANVGKLGGRPAKLSEAAYKIQQKTGRPQNRARLTDGEIVLAIGMLQAAIKDLEQEAKGRGTMSMIGTTVHYRSGEAIGQAGTIVDARRTSRGTPEYKVRFEDGTETWVLASNVKF